MPRGRRPELRLLPRIVQIPQSGLQVPGEVVVGHEVRAQRLDLQNHPLAQAMCGNRRRLAARKHDAAIEVRSPGLAPGLQRSGEFMAGVAQHAAQAAGAVQRVALRAQQHRRIDACLKDGGVGPMPEQQERAMRLDSPGDVNRLLRARLVQRSKGGARLRLRRRLLQPVHQSNPVQWLRHNHNGGANATLWGARPSAHKR